MSRRQIASSSSQPSMADNAISWLGGVFDQISSDFDSPVDPYPRYSKAKRAAVGSALPPGDCIASTRPLQSSAGRVSTPSTSTEESADFVPAAGQQHTFPAKRVVQPGVSPRGSLKDEEETPPTLANELPPIAPSEQCAGSNGSRKRSARQEVTPPPQQQQQQHHQHHEWSSLQEDLQEDADYRVARAKVAAKRLASKLNLIRQLNDTLGKAKKKKDFAVSQAGLLEGAATISAAKLELAQAEASSEKAKVEGYSRPGRIVRSLMARLDMGPQLDVDGAVRRVGEATRAHTSARAKADKVWDEVHRSVMELNATSTKLCRAQEAHARASRVLIALKEKADCAVKRAAATVRTVEVSRLYWEGYYEACEMGGKTDPASSKTVVTVEDSFTIYQGECRTKRARH